MAFGNIPGFLREYDGVIKVVGVLAGSGGLWFVWDKYFNRIRIRIRDIKIVEKVPPSRLLTFEAENIGDKTTSFERDFAIVCYSPKKEKKVLKARIAGERILEPHTPQGVIAHLVNADPQMLFMWFIAVEIPLMRGRNLTLRVRNAQGKQLGFFQFHWERILFLLFGKIPD